MVGALVDHMRLLSPFGHASSYSLSILRHSRQHMTTAIGGGLLSCNQAERGIGPAAAQL
jgi:hypothetical protein